MRDDRGYENYRGPCRVFLDDVELADVIAVDAEVGYVVHYVRDPAGKLILDRDKIRSEVKTGAIRIELMGATPANTEQSADAARVAAKRELRRFF